MSNLHHLIALLGRICLTAAFFWGGHDKVVNFNGNVSYAAAAGMLLPQVGIIIAIVIELLFSVLLILGYQVRLVALVMAGFAFATALIFHHNFADLDQLINFVKNVSIAGGFLQVVAFGGGRYSLDARQGR